MMNKITLVSYMHNYKGGNDYACLYAIYNIVLLIQRSVAEVEWQKTGLITTCRVGHEGKVNIYMSGFLSASISLSCRIENRVAILIFSVITFTYGPLQKGLLSTKYISLIQ